MLLDQQRVADAVELHRLAERAGDDFRVALHRRGHAADAVEPVEGPRDLARRAGRAQPQGDDGEQQGEGRHSAAH